MVISVEPGGPVEVYDVACEAPWHNFVVNKFVVSNCGKSVAGLAIAGRINGRVLWIAHRDELIEQPAHEASDHFPGLEFGTEKGLVANGVGKRIVFASIQTLGIKNTARLKSIMSGAPFSLVIYDETHHAVASSARRVLGHLGCLREDGKGPSLLGLTATIGRADKINLGEVFEEVIYKRSAQEAIVEGYLVPPKPIKVPLAFNRAALREKDGDYIVGDLEKEMERLQAAQATAASIFGNCGNRQTIGSEGAQGCMGVWSR